MIKFLIDEDLTPSLCKIANARGYYATHIQFLGWKGRTDFEIRTRMLKEDLTLVTGNWKDFRPLLRREEVHPGEISLPDVPRTEQIRLFEQVLNYIKSSNPPLDMVNRAILVHEGGQLECLEIP